MSVTPVGVTRAIYRERRSEFIAVLVPLQTEDEVGDHVSRLRREFPRARHICWAYRLTAGDGVRENSSDGGEPTGTAGLPLLNALRHVQVVNGGVFVVRIFRGVKLGRRGLAEAYGTSAKKVLAAADLQIIEPMISLVLECPLEFYGPAARILQQVGGSIVKDDSTDRLRWRIDLPRKEESVFLARIGEELKGQASIKT
jgi:uncharacterized YigZ family protein